MTPTRTRFFRSGGSWLALAAVASAPAAERITRGELRLENIPEVPAAVSERTSQYENVRSASLQAWDPAGRGILIRTRFGETTQVHRVLRPGAARQQLTFFTEPVAAASVSPDPDSDGFLLQRDVGGGEAYQIYWQSDQTGRATLLTDGTSRNGGVLWSNRGDRFAYGSTRRNGRDRDIYLSAMAAPAEARLVYEAEGTWGAIDWSPADARILLYRFRSITDSEMYVLDPATGVTTPFNPQDVGSPTIAYGGAVWSRDELGLFLVSDEASEFQRLRYATLADGKQTVLTPHLDWDVESLVASRDRRTLAFATNEEGRSRVYLLETESGKMQPVDNLPLGVISGLAFSPDGARLGFTMSTPRSSSDVFALVLATGEIERWTESEIGGLDASRFVEPQLVRYPTFDEVTPGRKREIPAWVYRPEAAAHPDRRPVVISIHGGPESQSRPSFSSTNQMLVHELGLVVIQPNVRGSSGYGKTYVGLDNGRRREDSVRDIGALLDWIATQPDLDPSRVIVMGGSYGGYMVLASMVHYHDRLAGGIDIVGISNFVSFLTNTQDYRRHLRRAEYGDESDPEMRTFLESISPLNHVHRITKPMLIVQGYNDPRVPAGEAEQIVAALRANGTAPWYVLAMNEGHGFARKGNSDFLRDVIFLMLQTTLRTSSG